MVYTTSGASADVSGGGVRLNMIPRDGGNKISGSVFSGYQNKGFQTNNLTRCAQGSRPEVRGRHRQALERRGVARRPDQEGQALVLRVGADVPSDTLPADVFNSGRRRRPAGVDPQKHQQRRRRAHLADQPEEQALGLQRPLRQESRRRDDGRIRSGDGSIGVELADLHDRIGQAHLDGDEQASCSRAASRSTTSATTTCTRPASRRCPGTPEWYTHDPQDGHRPRHDNGTPATTQPGSIRTASPWPRRCRT